MNRNIVILGAGLTGLSVGWNIITDREEGGLPGSTVHLFESQETVGGLARTILSDGYRFDYGPHNIHTEYQDVLDFMKNHFQNDIRRVYPTVSLYIRNRFTPYPIKGLKAVTTLPVMKQVPAVTDFIMARLRMFFHESENDDSFAEWIINRFGKTLYSVYFGPYASKTWKWDPYDLSSYVAEKRVPVLSITDYISRTLFKRHLRHHKEDPQIIESYYPKYGPQMLIDLFAAKQDHIHTSTQINRIVRDGDQIKAIEFTQNGIAERLDVDFFYNTIPLPELIKLLDPPPPANILKAADQLSYCGEYFLYLKINKPKVFDSFLTYFSSPDIPFNRIYDVRSYSADCLPEMKTGLCAEYTCNIGDEQWNSSAEATFERTMRYLEQHNLLNRKDVDGYFIKKVTHAYPRFTKGFQQNLEIILDYLSTLKNFVTLGRQGLFAYVNMDDVIRMGMRASHLQLKRHKARIDYKDMISGFLANE